MNVRKTISVAALLLIVIASVLAGFSIWSISDCEYLDDSDLYVERPVIPRIKNGYMDFEHASGTLIVDEKENKRILELLSAFHFDFTGSETFADKDEKSTKLAEARKILKTHPVALTMLDKGFPKPYCQISYKLSLVDNPAELPQLVKLTRLLLLRAYIKLERGNQNGALKDCLKAWILGRKIQAAKGGLIHLMMGSAICEIGMREYLTMLAKLEFSDKLLKEHLLALEKHSDIKGDFVTCFKGEYESMVENALVKYLNSEVAQEDKGDVLEKVTQVLTGFDGVRRRARNYMTLTYRELIRKNQENYRQFKDNSAAAELPCSITNLSLEDCSCKGMIDVYDAFMEQRFKQETQVAAARIIVALKMYKLENEKLPGSLEELAPRYLPQLPKDPYAGGPMRFNAKEGLVYSVGSDLQDNGGRTEKESLDWKEPAFRL